MNPNFLPDEPPVVKPNKLLTAAIMIIVAVVIVTVTWYLDGV